MKPESASRRSLITALAILATVFSTAGCAHSAYERHDGGYSRDYGYRRAPQVEVSVGWPVIVAPPPRVYYAPPPTVIYRDHYWGHRGHDDHRGHHKHGHRKHGHDRHDRH